MQNPSQEWREKFWTPFATKIESVSGGAWDEYRHWFIGDDLIGRATRLPQKPRILEFNNPFDIEAVSLELLLDGMERLAESQGADRVRIVTCMSSENKFYLVEACATILDGDPDRRTAIIAAICHLANIEMWEDKDENN